MQKAADAAHLTKLFQSVCWWVLLTWTSMDKLIPGLMEFPAKFWKEVSKILFGSADDTQALANALQVLNTKVLHHPLLHASCIGRSNWLMTSFSMLWLTMRMGGQCANWQTISTNASLLVVPRHGAWEGLAQTCTSPTSSYWHFFWRFFPIKTISPRFWNADSGCISTIPSDPK